MTSPVRPTRSVQQQGLALVEAVIVLPVMLLLLLAVAEMGRALFHYNTLHKLVRDAARYAAAVAIPDDTDVIDLSSALITTTRNLAVYGSPGASATALLPGLSVSDITVSAPDALHVRIDADYTYTPLFVVIPSFGLGAGDITVPTSMSASATMRAL
ncbi:MAG: TadE/TadG family type IV pilus assembly protein [Pseudomonadota bacterium]|jgi:Flp pilus assembly protein TadG